MRGSPMTYYISAKRFYFDHKVKEGGYLAVTDGRFGKWTENVPEGAEVLDYSDYHSWLCGVRCYG